MTANGAGRLLIEAFAVVDATRPGDDQAEVERQVRRPAQGERRPDSMANSVAPARVLTPALA